MDEVPDMTPHLPKVQNTWTMGTVLASVTSILSLLTVVGGIIWFSAQVDATVKSIPDLQRQQIINSESIAVLQSQMNYTNVRYAEIQLSLVRINDKLDKQRDR